MDFHTSASCFHRAARHCRSVAPTGFRTSPHITIRKFANLAPFCNSVRLVDCTGCSQFGEGVLVRLVGNADVAAERIIELHDQGNDDDDRGGKTGEQ